MSVNYIEKIETIQKEIDERKIKIAKNEQLLQTLQEEEQKILDQLKELNLNSVEEAQAWLVKANAELEEKLKQIEVELLG